MKRVKEEGGWRRRKHSTREGRRKRSKIDQIQ
jgi:hypothetical protein